MAVAVALRAKQGPTRAVASARSGTLGATNGGGTRYTLILFGLLLGTTVVFLVLVGARHGLSRGVAVAGVPARSAVARPPPTTPRPRTEPARAPPPPLPPAEPATRADPGWETCEINWWRGYVKSDFCAATTGGQTVEVARSPTFRWRSAAEPPLTDEIVAAHAALAAKLRAAGWEEVGTGNSWYRRRYRRRL